MSTGQWVGGILGAIVGAILGSIIPGLGTIYGAIYGAILGYTIGGYIDPVKPDVKQPGAPAPQGLQVMTNVIGNPIFDVLGTAKITGQLLFFGKEYNVPIWYRPAKGKRAISGYKYHASWALGICMGPVDCLYTVFRDQDPVWEGELTRPPSGGEATIQIEGMGTMVFYFGTDDQMPNVNAGLLLPDPTLNTGHRNLCWAFFDACFMNEYNRMPSMTFVVRKNLPLFSGLTNRIAVYDTNPAHAIWHTLVNKAGLPEDWVHSGDFLSVATTLYFEYRGISILFDTHQPTINYLTAINDHVDSILRFGSDGKFHPKLIRYDYTPASLPVVDESILLEEPSFSRRSWIDTINEVKVQYSEILGDSERGRKYKIAWLTGSGSDLIKFDLDSQTVIGTYPITGMSQSYVGDIDIANKKLILRGQSPSNRVFVVDTTNPSNFYSRSFSGYHGDHVASILSDTSTGRCWIVGTNTAQTGARITVYDYVNDTTITSFEILNAQLENAFSMGGYYGGSYDGSFIYFECVGRVVRINKTTYGFNSIATGDLYTIFRNSIYDGNLYIGTQSGIKRLRRISLSSFTFTGLLDLSTGGPLSGFAIDHFRGRLFVGAITEPSFLHRFDLSSFTETGRVSATRVLGVALNYDPQRNLVYQGVDFGTVLRIWDAESLTFVNKSVGMYVYNILLGLE